MQTDVEHLQKIGSGVHSLSLSLGISIDLINNNIQICGNVDANQPGGHAKRIKTANQIKEIELN